MRGRQWPTKKQPMARPMAFQQKTAYGVLNRRWMNLPALRQGRRVGGAALRQGRGATRRGAVWVGRARGDCAPRTDNIYARSMPKLCNVRICMSRGMSDVCSLGRISSARRLYGVYHGMAQRVVQCVDRLRTSAVLLKAAFLTRLGCGRTSGDGQSDDAK